MIKKIIPLTLVVSLFCNSAWAQTPPRIPSPEPDEKAQIAPVFKGDRSPFTGVVFSTRATATVIAEIDSFHERIAAEVRKAQRDAEAQKKFEISELEAKTTREKSIIRSELEAEQKHSKKLKDDVKRLEDEVSNAPSRLLWTGLGVAGGVLVTVLITFAVNQASK